MPLSSSDPSPDALVIAPKGELDIATAEDFRAELAQAIGQPEQHVVVDLSSVSFIDSSGLGAIVELHERLRREKRDLAVVAPEGTAVAVMVTLAGVRSRLAIFETRQAALEF